MSTAFEGLDKGSIVTPRARSGNRPNTSWSSTSKPLRRSVSKFHQRCSPSRRRAPLRLCCEWPLMIANGSENVLWCGRVIFAVVALFHLGADLYGLASHDRGLVGTDVGELDRPRRRGWPRFFRVETCRAPCTLKRVWPPE